MSAEFIPGQNARAIRDTRSESGAEVVKNAQVTVEAYFGGSQFMARLEGDTGLIFYTADFEPVEPPSPYPATPAPLDPSKVRAGDTVTLLVDPPDTHPAFTVAGETHSLGGPTVYLGGWRVDDLPDYVTLTDHQPATEPEPEWVPGTTGTATVAHLAGGTAVLDMRVMRVEWDGLFGFATQTGRIIEDGSTDWRVYDLVPDEPRPLPTREHLRNIVGVAHLGAGNGMVDRITDAVMSALGGAS